MGRLYEDEIEDDDEILDEIEFSTQPEKKEIAMDMSNGVTAKGSVAANGSVTVTSVKVRATRKRMKPIGTGTPLTIEKVTFAELKVNTAFVSNNVQYVKVAFGKRNYAYKLSSGEIIALKSGDEAVIPFSGSFAPKGA